jgi:ribosome-binding protein aMBF1 (putative translation factor)
VRPAYHELSLPGKLRSPVECGRKHCSICGRWRHVSDFDPRTRTGGQPVAFCQTCRRRVQREAYWRLTPEQRERKREYLAIYSDAKRREAGVPRRRRLRPSVVDRPEYVFLDIDPIVRELRRVENVSEVARRIGVDEHTLRRYLMGESRHIRLDLADRLALALGSTLWDLFGDAPLFDLRGRPRAAA